METENELSGKKIVAFEKENRIHIHNVSTKNSFLDMTFNPLWDYIPCIRSYIQNILLIYFKEFKYIYKIILALSEILENAVKYSNNQNIRILLKNLNILSSIELITYNYTDIKNIEQLKATIKEMNSSDSLHYYINKLKDSVKQKSVQSRLGLARIHYEADADLFARDVGNNLLEVKVTLNLK